MQIKKKHVRQKANITYLSLHAFLPGFCSSWRRGISRVLGTRRVTAVGGRENSQEQPIKKYKHLGHTLLHVHTRPHKHGQFPGQWRQGTVQIKAWSQKNRGPQTNAICKQLLVCDKRNRKTETKYAETSTAI